MKTRQRIEVERQYLKKKGIKYLSDREENIVEIMKTYYWNQMRIICGLFLLFILIFGIIN